MTPGSVTISAGQYTATTSPSGAVLQRLTHRDPVTGGERDLVLPADEGETAHHRGAVCAPWPNRVRDARWTHEGRPMQLTVTEPERGHALHGFVHDLSWTPTLSDRPDQVVWELSTPPQEGYPWPLRLRVRYHLDPVDGLTWELGARLDRKADRLGPAPFGACPHPYLVAGVGPVDQWSVTVPADEVLVPPPGRDVPEPDDAVSVDGTGLDLRHGGRLGDRRIDHTYTGLTGEAVDLRAPDGTGVRLSWGPGHRWLQVFTADWPDHPQARQGLAVEPMTCPPDALGSGVDLLPLTPTPTTRTWRIRALDPRPPGRRPAAPRP